MALPIYVIGSSNTDMVIKSTRLPRPGETIIGGTFFMNAGGKGANQAVAAARLGGEVTFIGCVGDDVFGKQTIDQLRIEGINTSFIFTQASQPSGIALINVDDRGENCITVAPGSNAALSPALLEKFFGQLTSGLVLVQLEIPLESVEFIAAQCKAKSINLILNPAPAQRVNREAMKNVYVITPNETEAELLTGIEITNDLSIKAAAEALHTAGAQQVVITLGSRGAYCSGKDTSLFVPVQKTTALDTTAAGDCFSGALVVALAQGSALPDAVTFACKAAAISVTRMGAQASMPYKHEIQ